MCCCKALTDHSSHDRHGEPHDHRAVWYGLTTLAGIYLFFVVERVVGLCSERKRTQNEHRVKVAFLLVGLHIYDVATCREMVSFIGLTNHNTVCNVA